jgi:hypothetical protein
MNYATEMGSVIMIYMKSFIEIVLGIQMLKRHTDGILNSLVYFYFFKIREVSSKCTVPFLKIKLK